MIFYKIKLWFWKSNLWFWRIKLWWYALWVRKDEFHKSLNMDGRSMFKMNEKERRKYINDLVRRRNIAHDRTLL